MESISALLEFGTSKYVIPLIMFAHGQAVSFMVSQIKDAAESGTSETASFLINNFWIPRVADKVTLPVLLACPVYLFMFLGVIEAIIAWIAAYALAFILVLLMRGMNVQSLNSHFLLAIVLAPFSYGLALYFILASLPQCPTNGSTRRLCIRSAAAKPRVNLGVMNRIHQRKE